jgi:hypothetical protein
MRQAGQRQLRHIGNIGIIEMAPATDGQHGGDALQINVTLLNRQRACSTSNRSQLLVR